MMPIKLFCSDLDGTLLGNPESTQRFKRTWEDLPPKCRPLLCFNSGRLVNDVIALIEGGLLPQPDYIVGGVGTQLYDTKQKRTLIKFEEQFVRGWDLRRVEKILVAHPCVSRQPAEFLHPYKSSWYLHGAEPEFLLSLRSQLAQAGLKVTVIYSSSRDLDVLPADADKGRALQWLCKHLSIQLNKVLVAGNTGNDNSMFRLPAVKGIVVENAHPELHEAVAHRRVYCTTRAFADGVLQGLVNFGIIAKGAIL